MPPRIVRLFRSQGPDRVAVVSTEPATSSGFLVRLARGAGGKPLQHGTVLGPFNDAELDARFEEILTGLRSEGFLPTGVSDLLGNLDSPTAAGRARAAVGLGWRRATEAVEPILARMPKAVDEVCSYLDALGAIGDPRAIPVLREQAGRKLLSRRRSAVEALRNLGDYEGLSAARHNALDRLPPSLRTAMETIDPEKVVGLDGIVQDVLALEVAQRGLALDTLYELATPFANAIVRDALTKIPFDQPHLWRYVKSILKRSMLRHDHAMFGWLSHEIESRGRASIGTKATVKSGYDGASRSVRIFSRRTQSFVRRLTWRYLRSLAIHRPAMYAHTAAEALVAYSPADAAKPRGLLGQYAGCYLLGRILWSAGNRFVLSKRGLRARFGSAADVAMPVDVREEPYPHLWDAQPQAYLRILAAAQLPEVHAFAIRAIDGRHPGLLQEASVGEIIALLKAPFAPTVELGLRELERRFDPQTTDWALLDHLLADERPIAHDLGERWLRQTAPIWTGDIERITQWLTSPHPGARALAAQLTIAGLDVRLRPALAQKFLNIIRGEPLADDRASGLVQVARAILLDDLDAALSFQDVAEWIRRGPTATLAVAGELLGRRRESASEVNLDIVAGLAQHDVATVRSGAHQLLRRLAPQLGDAKQMLFSLADSSWKDTRLVAVELLRTILSTESLSFDEVMRLLDSSQTEVQDFGQSLARERLGSLPAEELVLRLVQHPHPNMRRFALELAMSHLGEGVGPLEKLEAYFRTVLFELWPDRKLKHQVLAFLTTRGLIDEAQAAVSARIFSDIVRMEGRGDFERALEGLVRLKLAFDGLDVPVRLRLEDVA